ncbi:MAG TPA: class I tRNA ligase family protein, partial [Candidatus Dormibacteraeota bacterium]
YSLLAVNTLVFDRAPYKSVVCLAHIVDQDGVKMSKSRGNIIDPFELFDQFGADATRWYFYTSVTAGTEYRVAPELIQEVVRRFTLTLWNVYKFFVDYAEIDGFDPAAPAPPVPGRPVLDRWVLARLAQTVDGVRAALDAYDATEASRVVEAFVEDVSKWYVRRSRRRFWKSDSDDEDKRAAYATLFTVLDTLSRLLAPFMPFLAERIYRNLNGLTGDQPPAEGIAESVHLTDYPVAPAETRDPEVIAEMARLRRLVEEGLAARETARIKVRQPLAGATVRGEPLDPELEAIFADELNVKAVGYTPRQGDHEGVVLDTELTDDLRREGMVRELSRKVNELRKQAGLALDDRITLLVDTGGELRCAVEAHREHLERETLATGIVLGEGGAGERDGVLSEWEGTVAGERVRLGVAR